MVDLPGSRHKTSSSSSPTWENRTRACEVFIGVDETLFDVLERNMSEVVQFVQNHVDELNNIFIPQVFNRSTGHKDRYFRLSRVQVIFGNCVGFENCLEDSEVYLAIASENFSHFCLNMLFTYLDFKETLGKAYMGNLCKKTENTGVVTFLDQGKFMKFQKSSFVLAHEVGHILGADHDEEFKACKYMSFINHGFIMSKDDAYITKRQFSSCSIKSMHQGLRNLTLSIGGVDDCFVDLPANNPLPSVETSLCGNGIEELDEECDCNNDIEECSLYCYTANLSVLDRLQNSNSKPCHYIPLSPQLYLTLISLLLGIISMSVTLALAVYLCCDRCRKKKRAKVSALF